MPDDTTSLALPQGCALITAEIKSLASRNPRAAPRPGKEVHIAQLQPTSRPIEDRFSVHYEEERVFLGVYDGHHGASTADYVSAVLPSSVFSQPHPSIDASDGASSAPNTSATDAHVSDLLRNAFTTLDDDIVNGFKHDFRFVPRFASDSTIDSVLRKPGVFDRAQRAKSGCATLGVYIAEDTLHCTNLGDCRAILGRVTDNYDVEVIQLTEDLNAKNESELSRLKLDHPGEEETVVMSNRVLGRLMTTRSFGDAYFKLANTWYTDRIFGHERMTSPGQLSLRDQHTLLFEYYKSPPYLTAEPVITSQHISDRDRVLVIGSDGFWDLVSNEWVVQTVTESMVANQSRQDDGERVHTNLAVEVLRQLLKIGKKPVDDLTCLIVTL